MIVGRRNAIAVLAGAPALLLPRKSLAQEGVPEIEKGPFDGTRNIELPGHKGRLQWTQDAGTLKVELPEERPSDDAVTFKIAFAVLMVGATGLEPVTSCV
ncbi:MAG: hypothetical protein ABSC05_37620 [Candidatus Solibacter sp.]|jgi:hypothetical protein